MSKVRELIGSYFGASMQAMSYPAYFNYLNEGGKITARSLMDTQALILTILEEHEAKNEQTEQNFKDIREILEKLVDNKIDNKTIEVELLDSDKALVYKCETCLREFTNRIGLEGHKRSHKK